MTRIRFVGLADASQSSKCRTPHEIAAQIRNPHAVAAQERPSLRLARYPCFCWIAGQPWRRPMTPFFVQIKCELGKSYQVANQLAEAEIASEVYSTAGDFDLLVKFYVDKGPTSATSSTRRCSASRASRTHTPSLPSRPFRPEALLSRRNPDQIIKLLFVSWVAVNFRSTASFTIVSRPTMLSGLTASRGEKLIACPFCLGFADLEPVRIDLQTLPSCTCNRRLRYAFM